MRRSLWALGATVSISALGLASAPTAHACGGFFCNNQAIDQSGENIIFAYNDDGTVTTMVQIFYQGPSEEFAWILPIPAEPTVAVGTDAVFNALAAQSQPQFSMRTQTVGTCRAEPECPGRWDDFDTAGGGPRGGGADASAPAADAGAAVDVRLRANVGPYDVAVLAAGSAEALREWLADNDYVIPESALAEIDHYVALNHFFVALKLQKDRASGEIQPIVLTSLNDEPCIPLRLTRIAATPDMPVTAYFLGERRVRPLNYMLVEPDFEDSRLWTGGTSYAAYITRVVDDAGGHAFVTDFAGDTPSIAIELSSVDDLRTETDPSRFLQQLQSRGFTGDSQLMGILMRHLPPPATWDPQSYFNCLVGGWCLTDPSVVANFEANPFFPEALVDSLEEGIVLPRERAQALVDASEHMTRLFSTLSPSEMDEDPMFMPSDELDRDYSNVHQATMRVLCGPEFFSWTAPRDLVLPSGTIEQIAEGVPYYGSDSEYCDDRSAGFGPWTDRAELHEIAVRRNTRIGGGGMCTVSSGASGLSGAVVLAGLLALAWRRRTRAA